MAHYSTMPSTDMSASWMSQSKLPLIDGQKADKNASVPLTIFFLFL